MVELDPRLDNPHLQRFLDIKVPQLKQLKVSHPIVSKSEAPMPSPPTSAASLRPEWLPSPDSLPIATQALVERPAWLDDTELDSVSTSLPTPTNGKMPQAPSEINRAKWLPRPDSLFTGREDIRLNSLPTLLPSQALTKEASSEQKVAIQN